MKNLLPLLLMLISISISRAQEIHAYYNKQCYAISAIALDKEALYVATSDGEIKYKDTSLEGIINQVFERDRSCVCQPCCGEPYQIEVIEADGTQSVWSGFASYVPLSTPDYKTINLNSCVCQPCCGKDIFTGKNTKLK